MGTRAAFPIPFGETPPVRVVGKPVRLRFLAPIYSSAYDVLLHGWKPFVKTVMVMDGMYPIILGVHSGILSAVLDAAPWQPKCEAYRGL